MHQLFFSCRRARCTSLLVSWKFFSITEFEGPCARCSLSNSFFMVSMSSAKQSSCLLGTAVLNTDRLASFMAFLNVDECDSTLFHFSVNSSFSASWVLKFVRVLVSFNVGVFVFLCPIFCFSISWIAPAGCFSRILRQFEL